MKNKIFWIGFLFLLISTGVVSAYEGHEPMTKSQELREIITQVPLGFEGMKEMLNYHPLFVHFPIAFLLGSLMFYLIGRILKNEGLLAVGKWLLFSGTLAGAATVWTGLQAENSVQHGGEVHPILMLHQNLGITVLILSLLLSAWVLFSKANIPQKGQGVFLGLFVLLAFVMMQGADLGGRLVYLNGVGVGRKSVMEEKIPEAHEHEEGAMAHQH